ncbi:hypothetical protein D3C73_1128720 [compost metagenome]
MRMVDWGMFKDPLGRIHRQDHPVRPLAQHRPEAPDAASHIENQARLASDLERPAHQLLVTPERQPLSQVLRLRLQADAGVLLVILPGELELDGGGGLG